MILLLLGAGRDVISRGEATAEDISNWLDAADWYQITHLASDPWPGLPSVEKLTSEITAHLSSICSQTELTTIQILARFNGFCDEASAARLMAAASGTALSADTLRSRIHAELCLPAPTELAPGSHVLGKLTAAGLAKHLAGSGRPAGARRSDLSHQLLTAPEAVGYPTVRPNSSPHGPLVHGWSIAPQSFELSAWEVVSGAADTSRSQAGIE
jgi:hypothetical protein